MEKVSLKNYAKNNLLVLIILLIFAILFICAISIGTLYSVCIDGHMDSLKELVRLRSEVIEENAKYLIEERKITTEEAEKLVLDHVNTLIYNNGEFLFVRNSYGKPQYIFEPTIYKTGIFYPTSSSDKTPEELSLIEGSLGVLRGENKNNIKMLAAYSNLESLNIGIVAKIDLKEVSKPYFYAILLVLFIAFFTTFYCSIFFFKVRINILNYLNTERKNLLKSNKQLNYEIREHHETEKQLKANREKLRKVIRMTPIPMIIITQDIQVELFNYKFTEVFGYTTNDNIEREELLKHLFPNKKNRKGAENLLKNVDLGTSKMRILDITTKDGRLKECEVYIVVTSDASIVVLNDITEQNILKKDLVKAKEAAENLSEAKSSFLSTITHEIRTPINGVLGMSELLLNSGVTSEQMKYVKAIRASGSILLDLINDFLDISKIEANKLTLECYEFNLKLLLDDLMEIQSYKMNKKNINLILEFSKDVPQLLKGDPIRIRQVLLNLIENAYKFTSEGEIKVKVLKLSSNNNFITIEFSVADTGVGINKNSLSLIFDKFTQADTSTTRNFGGTGLGLAISKELVEAMGGVISVKSKINRGSTFSFFIELEQQEIISSNNIDPQKNNINIKPILIVDDNKINQKVAKGILEKKGFTVHVVSSGEKAIEALSETDYLIVLMDCNMPYLDGLQTTELIRSGKCKVLNRDIPIIAMTANDSEKDKDSCFRIGMDGFISKPIDPDKLIHLVERSYS